MQDTTPITFLGLLRKYAGNINRAHPLELKAARNAVPENVTPLNHFARAVKNYKLECKRKHKKICTSREGLCEPDKCCC